MNKKHFKPGNEELIKLFRKYVTFDKAAKLLWKIVRAVLIAGISFIILYPLFVKISVSIMIENDLYDRTVNYIPRNFTLDHFRVAWEYMRYPTGFRNSFILSFATSIFQVISCTLVAYGLARFKFYGKTIVFGLVVFTLIVPPPVILLPLYMNFRYFDLFGIIGLISGGKGINLLGSFWPSILLSVTAMGLRNGLYIYMIRQFFRGMPHELEEAAYIDGAGLFSTFRRIMLPSAVPVMITAFLFSFVWQWTDTFYASVFFIQRIPLLSIRLRGVGSLAGTGNWLYASQLTNSGVVLLIVPIIALYIFSQRFFVESIERSGIVG